MSPLSRDKGHTCSLRYHSRCRIATTLHLPISKTVRDNGDLRLLLIAYLKIKLSPGPALVVPFCACLFYILGVRADAPGGVSSAKATDLHQPPALFALFTDY